MPHTYFVSLRIDLLIILHSSFTDTPGVPSGGNYGGILQVEELKHSLSSLREQLISREGELQQLQSAQPHSFPQTAQEHLAASHAHLEKDLAYKTHLLESLQVGTYGWLIPLVYFQLRDKK